MKKKLISAITACTLALCLFTGCGSSEENEAGISSAADSAEAASSTAADTTAAVDSATNATDTKTSKHLNMSLFWWSDGLDPATDWNGWTDTRCGIGETLVTVDDKLQFQGQLADSWKMTNQSTWAFHIRQGVKFSNGDLLTPEIVRDSIQRTVDTNSRGSLLKLKSIDIDSENVVFHTTEPYSSFLAAITEPMFCIVDTKTDMSNYATMPVCTGPYKVTKYTENERFELEKNSYYWDGAPQLDTISVLNIDADTMPMSLQSGELDLAQGVSSNALSTFENNSDYTIYKTIGIREIFATMDMKRAPLNDSNVRKALSYGIDRDILAKIYGGGAASSGAPFPPSTDYGYNELNVQSYDADKAKDCLKAAGYSDNDNDGFVDKDGQKLTITIALSSGGDYSAICESIKDQLSKIGIDIEIQMMENVSDLMKSGDFDIIMQNWQTANTNDCQEFLSANWTTDGTDNYGSYSNQDFDEIIDNMNTTFDIDQRKECCIEAEQKLIDDTAAIFLIAPANNVVCSNKVSNVTVFPIDYYLLDSKLSIN